MHDTLLVAHEHCVTKLNQHHVRVVVRCAPALGSPPMLLEALVKSASSLVVLSATGAPAAAAAAADGVAAGSADGPLASGGAAAMRCISFCIREPGWLSVSASRRVVPPARPVVSPLPLPRLSV